MRAVSLLVLALLLALVGWLFVRGHHAPAPAAAPRPVAHEAGCPAAAPPSTMTAPAPWPEPDKVRWLAIGAVESPEANQISIEQDVLLLRKALGPSGVALL